MLKRTCTKALIAVLAVAFLTSCGSSKTKVTLPTGTLTTLVGDLPGPCDVVSFPFNVTELALTGSTSGQATVVSVPLNSSSVAAPEIRINLGCLRDFTTPLSMSTATVGIYNLADIYLTEPQMTFYDPTILPPSLPIDIAELTFQPLKLYQLPIDPPLVINKSSASVLQIDFDLLHMIQSITTDPTNLKVMVTATPEITFTPLTAVGSQGQGFGELDDLVGFVRSVTIPPPVNLGQYDGSFNLQLLSASISSAPVATINLSSSTQLYGFSNLNQLYTDSFCEVDAYIDDDGNFVANTVENEYTECIPPSSPSASPPPPGCTEYPTLAIIGPVTSLTRDTSGNVTTFNIWARDVEPNDPSFVELDSIPQVNLSSSTTYQYSSRNVNFANLPFGPANINVGQEVIVHGLVTPPRGTSGSGAPPLPTIVTAYKVYDKLQSIQGSFAALVQVAGDNKTGAFTFSPCPVMFQQTPTMVLTNNQTTFVNLNGLSSLTGGSSGSPTLLVKGLPFFEQQAQTIYGVPVSAGTLVILAKQVHAL
jgi:hypothetical protein